MFRGNWRTRLTTSPTMTSAKPSPSSAVPNRGRAEESTLGLATSTPSSTVATPSQALERCLSPIKRDGKSMVVTIAKATAAPMIAKAMNCKTEAKANSRIESLRLTGPNRRRRGAERSPAPLVSRPTYRGIGPECGKIPTAAFCRDCPRMRRQRFKSACDPAARFR